METTIFQIQRIFCSLVSYVSCENRSFPANFLLNRSSEKMVKSEESIKKIAICPVGSMQVHGHEDSPKGYGDVSALLSQFAKPESGCQTQHGPPAASVVFSDGSLNTKRLCLGYSNYPLVNSHITMENPPIL
jgi:hypothetical protein